jgi:UDP-N-acetylglucosamine 1-carboxyvinyltransferase
MMADGTTRITGVEHIERGYEDIVRDFRQLGADITLRTGESAIGAPDLLKLQGT